MPNTDYDLVSAARTPIRSIVNLKTISPKDSKFKTVGVTMERSEAISLARNILVIALDENTTGDIVLTAHRKSKTLSPTAYRHYKHS